MATINYLFTEDISNSPIYPNITRKISFLSHPEYEINVRKSVKTELVIRHFDGLEIESLNKSIIMYSDETGIVHYPIDLDIDENGNITGLDSTPLLNDFEWFVHWLQTDRGMLSMFRLIVKLFNVKEYDINGNNVGYGSPEAIYTFLDLKYFGIIK